MQVNNALIMALEVPTSFHEEPDFNGCLIAVLVTTNIDYVREADMASHIVSNHKEVIYVDY